MLHFVIGMFPMKELALCLQVDFVLRRHVLELLLELNILQSQGRESVFQFLGVCNMMMNLLFLEDECFLEHGIMLIDSNSQNGQGEESKEGNHLLVLSLSPVVRGNIPRTIAVGGVVVPSLDEAIGGTAIVVVAIGQLQLTQWWRVYWFSARRRDGTRPLQCMILRSKVSSTAHSLGWALEEQARRGAIAGSRGSMPRASSTGGAVGTVGSFRALGSCVCVHVRVQVHVHVHDEAVATMIALHRSGGSSPAATDAGTGRPALIHRLRSSRRCPIVAGMVHDHFGWRQ
jgi:hypothetical protein